MAITERIKLQFRWELFNLFNHPYFNIPNLLVFSSTRVYAGTEGLITSTLQPNREMQFGLKLTF